MESRQKHAAGRGLGTAGTLAPRLPYGISCFLVMYSTPQALHTVLTSCTFTNKSVDSSPECVPGCSDPGSLAGVCPAGRGPNSMGTTGMSAPRLYFGFACLLVMKRTLQALHMLRPYGPHGHTGVPCVPQMLQVLSGKSMLVRLAQPAHATRDPQARLACPMNSAGWLYSGISSMP